MPCSKVSINKNYKCDKATCICIPTDGKPCICVCENENGDIMRCDDCKCSTDSCQCKCDDAKCTCIVTKGAACVCVCRDERGNFKTCDCSCSEVNVATGCCKEDRSLKSCDYCSEKPEQNTCGFNCKCDGKRNFQVARHDAIVSKSDKCDQAGCVCIPTGGKSCICVCENENGDIMRCDDCKCSSDSCQCKCADAKCTCIVTKGAACVCVCRDERGNFKTCDCSCSKTNVATGCCKEELPLESCDCCSKKPEQNTCGFNCKCDGKRNFQVARNDATVLKSDECDQAGCVCIPTGGKSCICVCESENGNIVRCEDCKCSTGNCQCKCDDAKSTCIVTKRAACICVCRDKSGNIKTCDCSCTELNIAKPCCTKNCSVISKKCCGEQAKLNSCCGRQDKVSSDGNCKCSNNKFGDAADCSVLNKTSCFCCNKEITYGTSTCTRNNFKAIKASKKCSCAPTKKPCLCVSENEKGDLISCDDCKCNECNNCHKDGCFCIPESPFQKYNETAYLSYDRKTQPYCFDNAGTSKKFCCMQTLKSRCDNCKCCNCKSDSYLCIANKANLSYGCCNITRETSFYSKPNFGNETCKKNCIKNPKACYCVSEAKKKLSDCCADCICVVKCCATCNTVKSREVSRSASTCDSHISNEANCTCVTYKKNTCLTNKGKTNLKCNEACIFECEKACTCIPIDDKSVCAPIDGQMIRRNYAKEYKENCVCICYKSKCVCKNVSDITGCGNCY